MAYSEEELTLRVKRLEMALLTLQHRSHQGLGICVNAAMDDGTAPHWTSEPQIDWTRDIINLPDREDRYWEAGP